VNGYYIIICVGIHVTVGSHTDFHMYEILVLNRNWWTLWATYHFYQKRSYVSFHLEGIHYCTAHK